jgi:hypothetical protein
MDNSVTVSITPKGLIILPLIELSKITFTEAKELLNEFGEVMGGGIFAALLEIKTDKEAAKIILDWKKEQPAS